MVAAQAPRVLVLRGLGFNCEEESAAAWQLAGAQAVVVHAGDWLCGKVRLDGFELLHFPGGFSYGDDLGSGQVFANRIRLGKLDDGTAVLDTLRAFLGRGGRILGICNGFQILVRAGLVPNLGGGFDQQAALGANLCGHFVDRWVRCRTAGKSLDMLGDRVLDLPVRHGEGRLVFGSADVAAACVAKGLIGLHYVDGDGAAAHAEPANPNGAELAAAGLWSEDGQVFGLMPHPEAYLTFVNHPNWGRRHRSGLDTDAATQTGLAFFRAWVAQCTGGA
ncbi:MAG: phosphoribosylformylglycinamidine synthase subunit PurQ [Deltaproteobacteria bacterium]|nr:phosphoribosylformylglycinamidine synthase subunit PurQ [Deltaproteobacteria bacterium]